MKYLFQEPKDTAVFTCKHVLEDNKVIQLVMHDSDDGSWQFLCNEKHSESDGRILSLEEITEIDNSVNTLHDLPLGYCATRDLKHNKWIRTT